MIASLELAKRHCRADDFDDDDAYIAHLLQVAEDYIVRETRRTAEELRRLGGGDMPAAVVHAALMLVDHWYEQRAAVGAANLGEAPYTLGALLKPYTRLTLADTNADLFDEGADEAEGMTEDEGRDAAERIFGD